MIYFDTEKEAYAQRETIEKWGKTYLTECTDEIYAELQIGKRMWQYNEIVINPNYEEEQAQKERARKDNMTLTPADVWRALYKAKQMRSTDLLALIEEQMTGIDMNLVEIEFGASMFYRGAKLGSGRLFDVIGGLLGYTPEDMDYLFEHKELPEVEEDNIEETEEL